MKKEILDGNRLIAVFMKLKFGTDNKVFINILDGSNTLPLKDLKFHSSYDCLIPVIKKISKMQTSPLMIADVMLAYSRFEIQEMWESVVRFIKWYNDRPKGEVW